MYPQLFIFPAPLFPNANFGNLNLKKKKKQTSFAVYLNFKTGWHQLDCVDGFPRAPQPRTSCQIGSRTPQHSLWVPLLSSLPPQGPFLSSAVLREEAAGCLFRGFGLPLSSRIVPGSIKNARGVQNWPFAFQMLPPLPHSSHELAPFSRAALRC